MMLLSNPKFRAATVTIPVTTMEVVPTILQWLGLPPTALKSVNEEGTQTLPKF
jgi:hypothetical protein